MRFCRLRNCGCHRIDLTLQLFVADNSGQSALDRFWVGIEALKHLYP